MQAVTRTHDDPEIKAQELGAEITEMERRGYVFRGVTLVRIVDQVQLVTLYTRMDA